MKDKIKVDWTNNMLSPEVISDYSRAESRERTSRVPLAYLEQISHQIDPLIGSRVIHASGEGGRYSGSIREFFRDEAETIDSFYETHMIAPNGRMTRVMPHLLHMLEHIAKEDDPRIGKQKGKVPHERGRVKEGYPEDWPRIHGIGEIFDSLDATDLTSLTFYKIIRNYNPGLSPKVLPRLREMALWSLRNFEEFGGGAAYIGARFDEHRNPREGLTNQMWRDSEYSIVDENGEIPKHPIYPAREQALRYEVFMRASKFFERDSQFSKKLRDCAEDLKAWFNRKFIRSNGHSWPIVDALDGDQEPVTAALTVDEISVLAHDFCLIDDIELRDEIITKSFEELYNPRGGYMTVSGNSVIHKDNVYHGPKTIWMKAQKDVIIALEISARRVEKKFPGLAQGYREMALQNAEAMLRVAAFYRNPIELTLVEDGSYKMYEEFNEKGEKTGEACRVQAFSGGAMEYAIAYLRAHGINEITALVQEPNGAEIAI